VKIIDGLYVGGGLTIFSVAEGGTTVTVNTTVQTQFSLKLKPDVGGLVGIFAQPADWISFGLCYRTEREFKLTFNANVSALGIQTPIELQALDFFTPQQVSGGCAIDLGQYAILALDLTYLNYSAFREPFIVDSSTTLPVQLNVHSNFHDTVIPRIGVEITPTEWLTLRGGYFFRMSPVGSQRTTTFNLVDSDEHVLSIGVGFEYKGDATPAPAADPHVSDKPAPAPQASFLANGAVGIDLFFQIHILQGTSVTKSATNDPIGGYNAGGEIYNMGFNIYGRF
jgi:Outer membrane protein transport protein (OMPP1/FadL/TodX)